MGKPVNQCVNIPVNQGTIQTWNLEEYLKASECFVGSRKYLRFLQILTQYKGLISVKGNEEFEKRQNSLFESCLVNGYTVITFKSNKLQIWTVAGEMKFDINGELEYVDVIPYIDFGNQMVNNRVSPVRLYKEEAVCIKSGFFGLSLLVIWNKILEDHVELMEIFLLNAKLNIKKILYIINNEASNITNQELASIMDRKTPVIKSLNPITQAQKGDIRSMSGEQNVFQPLDLSSGSNTGFDDVVNHWIFETNLMGLFADEYKKKERNTAGENEFTQANTVVIHDVLLREWKRAEKEIKEKFNIEVEFYKTMELSVENNNEDKGENTDVETE